MLENVLLPLELTNYSESRRAGQTRAEALLEEVGLGERLLIGVNLGTTWRTKRWSLENFAAVIAQVQKRFGARILLTGSPAEIPLSTQQDNGRRLPQNALRHGYRFHRG